MQEVPRPRLALSAYSAVTLLNMFPEHTNSTDPIFRFDRFSSFSIAPPTNDRQTCSWARRMPTHGTFGKSFAHTSQTERNHGTAADEATPPRGGYHRRVWSYSGWRQGYGMPFRRERQLCSA